MEKERDMDTIRSVADYISHLKVLRSNESVERFAVRQTFFRGQANKDWPLIPTLYRNGYFEKEAAMIKEILNELPDEFNLADRVDILAKLQHYGFPTRLLDITANPLVALYFACFKEKEMDNDGAIYVFLDVEARWSDHPYVNMVMEYIFQYTPHNVNLSEMLMRLKNRPDLHILHDEGDILDCLTMPVIAIIPRKITNRLIAQEGAFFLFGMNAYPAANTHDNTYSFTPLVIDDLDKLGFQCQKLIIPARYKREILDQLDLLGINERILFADLEHQLKYYMNKHRPSL